jgi:CRP/FNR family cyclic AMP-dependent transcriptional regulator
MNSLNDLDLHWLITNGSKRRFKPNEVLIYQGVMPDHMYIILDGCFAVAPDGNSDSAFALLRSGEVVGELSFIDRRPPTVSVTATEPAHVLAIPKMVLQTRISEDEGFASRFYHAIAMYLVNRLRVSSGRLGYGDRSQDGDDRECTEQFVDEACISAARFESVLSRLHVVA